MSYVAGHHTAFFSLTSGSSSPTYFYIGSTRDGYRHRERIHSQPVIDDSGGEAEVDAIQQGVDVSVEFDWIEYDLFKPVLYSASTGTQTQLGLIKANVGKRLTDLAGILVLTPKPGTPAATEIGAGMSRIYYKAIIAENVDVLLASKLRQGPAMFKCYPDVTNSNEVWAIAATPSGVTGSQND